jgi:TatD DNase family protein
LDVHLQVARELSMPIIIHCRKAHNEMMKSLSGQNIKSGGVIHAFSGSIDLAKQYWALGFYLGVGGTITYERANKTRETVKQLPIEAMVLETDAPDMPLSGKQGQRNSPENIPEVARTLANIRGDSLQYIAQQTTENTKKLFFGS